MTTRFDRNSLHGQIAEILATDTGIAPVVADEILSAVGAAIRDEALNLLRGGYAQDARHVLGIADSMAMPVAPPVDTEPEPRDQPDPDWYVAQQGADAALHRMDEAGLLP